MPRSIVSVVGVSVIFPVLLFNTKKLKFDPKPLVVCTGKVTVAVDVPEQNMAVERSRMLSV